MVVAFSASAPPAELSPSNQVPWPNDVSAAALAEEGVGLAPLDGDAEGFSALPHPASSSTAATVAPTAAVGYETCWRMGSPSVP